ncbi:MAG: PPC domain-containing protein [Planctomycetes bacterium]|nr:PPC domain-containing protein [Planctomycetota bacterium]
MSGRRGTAWLALGLALLWGAPALAASPQLNRVIPRGAQRGKTLELRFYGRRLEGPQEVLLYDEGLAVLGIREIERKNKKGRRTETREVRVRIKIAADARLGEHRLRLRTSTGITELRTFWVGVLPERREKEPNGSLARAQVVPLDVTLAGRIRREDTDWFAFSGKKGERVTAELVAMRLGDVVFDASLQLLDAERFELASSDDTAFARQDPVLSAVLPRDGTYYLVLRESSFGGSNAYHYRLHLGHFPRPGVCFPPGGVSGQRVRLDFLGSAAGVSSQTFTLPSPGPDGLARLFPTSPGGVSPTPLRIATGDLPCVTEVEPNHRKAARAIPAPGAVHGRIGKARDQDWFTFKAKKGQRFTIRVRARELGSPLDAVANVFVRNGRHVIGNDDLRGDPDALVRFRAPATGEYGIRIRDFLNRGGEDFVYRLEVAPERPTLALDLRPIGRQTQVQQTLSVPRGGRAAVLLRTQRRGFREALAVTIAGLGSGVVVEIPQVPAYANVVPLVLSAHPAAALGGGLVEVRARSLGKAKVEGRFAQTIPLSVGRPNRSVYHRTRVDRMAVGVIEAAPFRIELVAPRGPLVRNGTKQLLVRVVRNPGFKGGVVLQLLYDPPGVRSRRNVVVKPKAKEARILLNANGKAALGRWPIVVQARANVAGQLWISSRVVNLTIGTPPVGLAMSRIAAPQGGTSELGGRVLVKVPFEGEARVELLRLPRHVTAKPLPLTKDTKTLRFALSISPKARPGRHRLYCRVTLPGPDPVVLHTGWTELRIDRPAKDKAGKTAARKTAAKKTAAKKTAAKKKVAPLRRLDQLRRDYEQAKPKLVEQPATPDKGQSK